MLLPDWPAPNNIAAISTTREGGVSQAPFASLNLGLHVGDQQNDVLTNRQRLATHLPAAPVWLNQVHSSDVVVVDAQFNLQQKCSADALYTQLKNQPLAIMTADCLPILLSSQCGSEVAAIHGGWRGLHAGIIANTLNCFSCPAEHIIAWFGPAIGATKFEVGSEVRTLFCEQLTAHTHAFAAQGEGKYLADIYRLAKEQLLHLGISNISGGEHCTVSNAKQFFSYRRDGQTGRMASLIWRK